MTAHAFDIAMRRLHGVLTRRAFSSRALRAALALGLAGSSDLAEARKKRKRRKNKNRKRNPSLERNAFGCVDVGLPCRGDGTNCCSGLCEGSAPKAGKKDASRCVAHDVGGCLENADFCTGLSPVCGTEGVCFRTTGNASFCGNNAICTTCTKDTDCEPDFGPGAACIVCPARCPEGGTLCAATFA